MYLLRQAQPQPASPGANSALLQLMGERLKKVRRLKNYEAALRDCIDIVWDYPGAFTDEERRVASVVLKTLAEAWATGSLTLKNLRRLEAACHLYG